MVVSPFHKGRDGVVVVGLHVSRRKLKNVLVLSSYSGDYTGLSSQIPEFNSPWERSLYIAVFRRIRAGWSLP